jgi:gamma-glutamylcyclotransferase
MYTHTPFSRPEKRNAQPSNQQQQFTELYFSYSSNLSPTTMKGRYPNSLFCGLAKLPGYRWSINSTQYANIVPSPDDNVYGALYFISAADETDLDVAEGVPDHYEKQWHEVERVDASGEGTGQVVKALMYVDAQRPDEGVMKEDYVVWIRKAVRDAKAHGLPDGYVEKYISPYLPANEEGEVEKDMDPIRIMFGKEQFK